MNAAVRSRQINEHADGAPGDGADEQVEEARRSRCLYEKIRILARLSCCWKLWNHNVKPRNDTTSATNTMEHHIVIENLAAVRNSAETRSPTKANTHTREVGTLAPITDTIIIYEIFEFVGSANWRYIAGTNYHFRLLYKTFLKKQRRSTSLQNAVSSLSCAKLCWEENRGRPTLSTKRSRSKPTPVIASIGNAAALYGRINVLVWAYKSEGYPLSSITCDLAARNGHLEILKWARDHGCDWSSCTCTEAATNGHLKVLIWAHQNGCDWDFMTTRGAAANGHLEVLKWARKHGCEWDASTCRAAAEHGNLEVLQWAHRNGCDWDAGTCQHAAHSGHLNVLQWARENGCDWDDLTCLLAAENGHLEVLRWAHQNGCSLNSWICSSAAANGHLEVLKWARQQGCHWDSYTRQYAAEHRHMEILKWARENGCPEYKRPRNH